MIRPQVGFDGIHALFNSLANGRPIGRSGFGGRLRLLKKINIETGLGFTKFAISGEHDVFVDALLFAVFEVKVEHAANGHGRAGLRLILQGGN